jgi:hypothetical protein
VAIHGPAPRMTLKKGVEYLPALRRAAKALTETFDDDVEGARTTRHVNGARLENRARSR